MAEDLGTALNPIRVLIVDDHQVLRMGLSVFLENHDDMLKVGEAANGQEAIDLCRKLNPDVVLMDLGMPIMDGFQATAIITHDFPQIRVIVLTSTFSDEKRTAALAAGASAYFRKNIGTDTLATTIRQMVA